MHTANNPEAPVTPGPIFEMLLAYQRTAALKAAIDLDVFGALSLDLRFTVYDLRARIRTVRRT